MRTIHTVPSIEDSSFEAALIALTGTTDATNPWRTPVIETLVELGVEQRSVYNPVVTDRPWDPVVDQAEEDFQKRQAKLLVHHLGRTASGALPFYSGYEFGKLADKRSSGSLAAILDTAGLADHPRKQLAAIENDIHRDNPDIYIAHSVGESLYWITEKLELGGQLANLALRLVAERIDTQHSEQLEGLTPEALEQIGQTKLAELARPHIERVEAEIKSKPFQRTYDFGGLGSSINHGDEIRARNTYVQRYFFAQGWKVSSGDAGQMLLRVPVSASA
jgi:hypothetical protein